MKKFALAAVTLGALLATLLVGVSATSAAGTLGYTIIDNGDGTCDLATLDLTTGDLTNLPAASSAEACVNDLAADADGAVWGIAGDTLVPGSVPAAPAPSSIKVVAFSADGTPASSTVSFDAAITGATLVYGGIAFDPDLGALLHIGVGGTDPACPTGGGVCLFTYDPETGLATAIGDSGMSSTTFDMLTSCSSGLYTVYDPDGVALATVDPATGAVTGGASLSDALAGYDCAPGGDTLYAVSGGVPTLFGNGATAVSARLGTVDPETGDFTEIAPVSDPGADIHALAVPGAPTPTPTTTPTTTPAPAVAADSDVAPTFTG